MHELRGTLCVLHTSLGLTEVDGAGFDLLEHALASVGRGGSERFAALLARAGIDKAQSRTIAAQFAKQNVFASGETSFWSPESLGRFFKHHGRRMEIRIGPLRQPDLAQQDRAVLLQLHATGWRAMRRGCCLQCAVLWEIQSDRSPTEAAKLVTARRRRSAVALSAVELKRIRSVVDAASLVQDRWVRGEYSDARIRMKRQRIAAGCSKCVPSSEEPMSDNMRHPALCARQVIKRLGVSLRERVVERRGRHRLPIVRVAWAVALRARTGRRSFDGNFAAQLGVGSDKHERLLTGRAEVIERASAILREPDLRATPTRQLAQAHLPQEQWGLYTTEQYASPSFPFQPVDADTPIDWMWATDLVTGQRLLVPAAFTMTSRLYTRRFVSSSSNGVATHTSAEAAIRSALLEVIERDAIQIAWYGGVAAFPFDARRIPIAPEFRAHFSREGWTLRFAWLQGRAGLVVVAVLAEMQSAKGRFPKGATVLCSAAAGEIKSAAMRALRETVMVTEALTLRAELPGHRDLLTQTPRLSGFWNVGVLTDITFLYLSPAMLPVVDAFFSGPRLRTPAFECADDAASIAARLRQEGLRPLSIDLSIRQSKPFVTRQALIVGTQPLAFGTGVLRLGTGLLPTKLPVRSPPLPAMNYRLEAGVLNPYVLPLA